MSVRSPSDPEKAGRTGGGSVSRGSDGGGETSAGSVKSSKDGENRTFRPVSKYTIKDWVSGLRKNSAAGRKAPEAPSRASTEQAITAAPKRRVLVC